MSLRQKVNVKKLRKHFFRVYLFALVKYLNDAFSSHTTDKSILELYVNINNTSNHKTQNDETTN